MARRGRGLPANLGLLVLGLWLILTALTGLLGLTFAGLGTLMTLLALIAGVLLLVQR